MNQWLAQVYGTNQGGEDLEKTAQMMLLEKLAAEEGVDLSGLPPEQLDQLATQVSQEAANGAQQGQPQFAGQEMQQGQEEGGIDLPPEVMAEVEQLQAQGVPDEEIEQLLVQAGFLSDQGADVPQSMLDQAGQIQAQQGMAPNPALLTKEAQAKLAEMDFCGRAMAHAYHNELQKIASGGLVDPSGNPVSSGGRLAAARRSVERVTGPAMAKVRAGAEKAEGFGRRGTDYVGHQAARAGKAVGRAAGHVGRFASTHRGKLGLAGATLATGGAIYGAKKALEKNAFAMQKTAGEAAVEALAEARAIEILRANGYNI